MSDSRAERPAAADPAWERAQAAFLLVDERGRCVRMNPAATTLLGCEATDCAHRASAVLLRPSGSDKADAAIPTAVDRALASDIPQFGVDVFARDGGNRLPLAFAVNPLPEGGALLELWDLSRLDPALWTSAQSLALALEAGGIGLYDFDPRSKRFIWNAVGKSQVGLPADADVSFDTFLASLHPDDRAHFDDELARAVDPARGGSFRMEYRVIGPRDGIERWLEDWGHTFFDADGRPVRMIGATVDITAHKRAEARARETLTALRLALQTARSGYYDWNLVTDELFWSEELRQLMGVSPDAPVNSETWQKMLFPEDLPVAMALLDVHLADGGGELRDHRIRCPDGEVRWLTARSRVFYDDQNRPVRMIGIATDITERVQAETALRDSEARYRTAFEQAAVGIVEVDEALCLTRSNRKFAEMLGYSPADLVGKPILELNHPDDREMVMSEVNRLRLGELDVCAYDKRYLHKSGREVWVHLSISAVRNADGCLRYLVGIAEDISARKHAEERLEAAQAKLQMAVDIAGVGFWEEDLRTGDVYLSPEYKRQLGYAAGELPDTFDAWASRLHPDDREATLAAVREFTAGRSPSYETEFRMRHKDGGYRWIYARATRTLDDQGRVVKITGTHLDITERKEAERRIRHAAQHDALTALAGRELSYELAEHQLAVAHRAQRNVAFLFIDLDRFKPINDTYGHAAGDAVLRQIAQRLRASVREGDLLGRLGGDEFLAVLPNVSGAQEVASIAHKILGRLSEPCAFGQLELTVTPSIGISLYPQDASDVDTLIRYADTAMYEAKLRGRHNFHFFTREMDVKAMEFLAIEDALKRGFSGKEFSLHYQALVDTVTGQVAGVEALLRWTSATLAAVGPARFIPVAETTGMIMPLGDWVLGEACRQHQAWKREGLPPIPVAVNVSPVQFRQSDMRERIERALAGSGMTPEHLHLEVTESTIMENLDSAVAVLNALKSLGLKVSLDDFGTGYSSLNYLSRLPIDKLKVDQSFIQNMKKDCVARAITEAIFALGQALDLDVVAEGVDSVDALEFLRTRRCRQVQGFLLCPPLPPDRFADWYRGRMTA